MPAILGLSLASGCASAPMVPNPESRAGWGFRVLDAATKAPVEGARVTAIADGHGLEFFALSGPDGWVRTGCEWHPHERPRDLYLEVTRPGYRAARVRWDEAPVEVKMESAK